MSSPRSKKQSQSGNYRATKCLNKSIKSSQQQLPEPEGLALASLLAVAAPAVWILPLQRLHFSLFLKTILEQSLNQSLFFKPGNVHQRQKLPGRSLKATPSKASSPTEEHIWKNMIEAQSCRWSDAERRQRQPISSESADTRTNQSRGRRCCSAATFNREIYSIIHETGLWTLFHNNNLN